MSGILAEAPPRALPAGADTKGHVQLYEGTMPSPTHRAIGHTSAVAALSSAAASSSLYPVRGAVAPVVRSSMPSSLPAHAALVASLGVVPPAQLEIRKHTDHYRPIVEKGHSVVYVDQLRKSDHGYILRPNFRQLHESDNPAYHRSLNYITSLPPSLQSTHGGNSPAMLGGGSSSSPLASKNLLTSPFSSDRLMIVRAPRRSANEEMTRREQEQKDAQADYDAGGLRPRAIKSVAALLSAGVAAAGKKPTHLRIGGLMAASSPQADDDLVVATRPTLPVASSTLARFTRGLKLPSRSDATSASRAPPMIELGDDVLLESPVPVMLPTTHYLGSGGEAPEEKEETSPRDIATPPPKEAVLIAAEQGATCCICTTSDFVEPWISHCKHICCSECWITWLNENPDKQCPECESPISLEQLRPIALCPICTAIPTEPWTAPCRHTCCTDCWKVWLTEHPVCAECQAPVDLAQLPQT